MAQPLWDELEQVADRLAVAGQVALPDLRTLRAAAVQMGNWFEANQDLRTRLAALEIDNLKYRVALQNVQDASSMVARYAGLEAHEFGDDSFSRDLAPFKNIMVANGVEPYAKPKRTRKVAA